MGFIDTSYTGRRCTCNSSPERMQQGEVSMLAGRVAALERVVEQLRREFTLYGGGEIRGD